MLVCSTTLVLAQTPTSTSPGADIIYEGLFSNMKTGESSQTFPIPPLDEGNWNIKYFCYPEDGDLTFWMGKVVTNFIVNGNVVHTLECRHNEFFDSKDYTTNEFGWIVKEGETLKAQVFVEEEGIDFESDFFGPVITLDSDYIDRIYTKFEAWKADKGIDPLPENCWYHEIPFDAQSVGLWMYNNDQIHYVASTEGQVHINSHTVLTETFYYPIPLPKIHWSKEDKWEGYKDWTTIRGKNNERWNFVIPITWTEGEIIKYVTCELPTETPTPTLTPTGVITSTITPTPNEGEAVYCDIFDSALAPRPYENTSYRSYAIIIDKIFESRNNNTMFNQDMSNYKWRLVHGKNQRFDRTTLSTWNPDKFTTTVGVFKQFDNFYPFGFVNTNTTYPFKIEICESDRDPVHLGPNECFTMNSSSNTYGGYYYADMSQWFDLATNDFPWSNYDNYRGIDYTALDQDLNNWSYKVDNGNATYGYATCYDDSCSNEKSLDETTWTQINHASSVAIRVYDNEPFTIQWCPYDPSNPPTATPTITPTITFTPSPSPSPTEAGCTLEPQCLNFTTYQIPVYPETKVISLTKEDAIYVLNSDVELLNKITNETMRMKACNKYVEDRDENLIAYTLYTEGIIHICDKLDPTYTPTNTPISYITPITRTATITATPTITGTIPPDATPTGTPNKDWLGDKDPFWNMGNTMKAMQTVLSMIDKPPPGIKYEGVTTVYTPDGCLENDFEFNAKLPWGGDSKHYDMDPGFCYFIEKTSIIRPITMAVSLITLLVFVLLYFRRVIRTLEGNND